MKVSKKKIQKEQTRLKILNAFYRVFSQEGYFCTIDMAAKEAGIANGSIYVHFPSFNHLLVCFFEDFFSKAGLRFHDAAEKGRDLEYILSVHLNVPEENEDFYIYLISGMDLLLPEVRAMFLEFQSVVSLLFYEMFEKEKKEQNDKTYSSASCF